MDIPGLQVMVGDPSFLSKLPSLSIHDDLTFTPENSYSNRRGFRGKRQSNFERAIRAPARLG